MDIVTLQTKEQLDIFMNPQRQKLLRVLAKSAAPSTPKALSLVLGISASSVQYHLKKLESLGLVHVDHTAMIRGITAKYYAATKVTVHIGKERDGSFSDGRVALIKNLVADVLDDTITDISKPTDDCTGDVMTGIVHLTPERRAELLDIVRDFLQENAAPSDGTEPWEYALIYHCTGEKQ